jgi:ATP-binding cassette subfamily B protein RaxB
MTTHSWLQFTFKRPRSLPLILQDEIAECGHACVAMISRFWGNACDLRTLRQQQKPSLQGVTLRELNALFEDIGFQTRALRVPLSELHLIQTPAILHWNMNHFVVLKQVKKNHVMIHDPAMGVRRCSLDEVSRSFTGIVLEVEKTQTVDRSSAPKTLKLSDFMKSMTGSKSLVALLLMLSFVIEILNLMNPLFMQYVTDEVIGASGSQNLIMLTAGFTLLMLMQAFTETIRSQMVLYLSMHLTEKFSAFVVAHLFKLPLDFFASRSKGDIQSKVQSIDQIQRKVGADFINTVLDGLMMSLNVGVMLIYSSALTMVVLVALVIYVMIRYASYHFLKKQAAASIHQHAKVASVFLESLQAMTSIKSFLKERVRFTTWRNGLIDALNLDIRVARMQTMLRVANQLLFHLEHMVVIYAGATLVLANQLSIGMLFAFLAYRQQLVNKASSFIQQIVDYQLIAIQLSRLSDIVFQPPEVIQTGVGCAQRMQGALSLQQVSFQYGPTSAPIIHQLQLDIKAGEKVAIIGPSGCGKTTVLKIMMGLLKPTAGEIWVDHMPLAEFGLKNYRELTAAVMQEDTLLSGSIVDNITFFDDQVDREAVYHVAQLACIHETIRQFPMGYETLIGEMGSSLSGGQKQRILLARALYKQPKILFLDEATSHLDEANERRMNQALASLSITQVIVAHRQETIDQADRVIDLQQLAMMNDPRVVPR